MGRFESIQAQLDRPFGMWDCKHTIFPIILGVSAQALDGDTLKKYRTDDYKRQDHEPLERILKAQLRVTEQEMRNLSRTTVVTEAYRNAVDVAVQAVQSGLIDYKSAIRSAMTAAGKNGLRVQYASGMTRRLDSAMRQNVLDGVRSLNNDVL